MLSRRALQFSALLALSGCGSESEDEPRRELPARSTARAESADPARFGVSELEPFWHRPMANANVAGHDGGASVPIAGGAIWSFGDTYLGNADEPSRGITNSGFVAGNEWPPVVEYLKDASGSAREVLPLSESESFDKHRVWPGGGLRLGEYSYVFFERLDLKPEIAGPGATVGIARAHAATPDVLERVAEGLPLSVHDAALAEDGYVYAWAVRGEGFDSRVQLGRVSAEAIEEPAAWELLEDRLVENVFGQVNVTFNRHLGRWLMVHPGNPFERPRSIVFRTAASPTGPFSAELEAVRVPAEPESGGALYAPYLHEELDVDDGRLLRMSYCLMNEGVPHLVEIELLPGALD